MITLPSVNTAPAITGKNASDYEKFVVVDTNGSLVEAGKVVYSLDLVKDDTLQNKANFLSELFELVGMDFKVRETRTTQTVKATSPKDLIKGLKAS
ncbi:MAG: hypothetical protein KAH01_04835 [Caldisericia bacterium]|nr:hypothetical protein [Caldisericia bacterium]